VVPSLTGPWYGSFTATHENGRYVKS
jgi:hypothetical protein